MANTLVTPEWITKQFMRDYEDIRNRQPKIGDTIQIRLPKRYAVPSVPVDGKVLLALGAAAVIANPTPISRRSLLGLSWRKQ